jgi:transposase-like protein
VKNSASFAPVPQDSVQRDLRDLLRGAVRAVLETTLEEAVVEMIGAERGARAPGRKDVRNGSYLRSLVTGMGKVEVEVPRTREHGAPVDVIGRYKRRTAEVDDAITAAYVGGISTRGMADVTEALMAEGVSRSTVSRVTKVLDARVDELRNAPITQQFPYLYLDATFIHARWARVVENVAALVAYGVGEDGHRHLLAVTLGSEESEASWEELLKQLLERGLTGVRLVIADHHAGLGKAARRLLPEAQLQRCIVHLERNVLSHTPQRLRARLARRVSAVFAAPSLAAAKERLKALQNDFGRQLPEALKCLADGFADATRFFSFPKEHWKRIRSTNGLERLHGELKRRIRSIGAFPDRTSALRLITTVALETASAWSDRRYLDMSVITKTNQTA